MCNMCNCQVAAQCLHHYCYEKQMRTAWKIIIMLSFPLYQRVPVAVVSVVFSCAVCVTLNLIGNAVHIAHVWMIRKAWHWR